MYPTMYLFKKSYIMLLIDLGRTTERPLITYYLLPSTIIILKKTMYLDYKIHFHFLKSKLFSFYYLTTKDLNHKVITKKP